jgi:hypothetical protein
MYLLSKLFTYLRSHIHTFSDALHITLNAVAIQGGNMTQQLAPDDVTSHKKQTRYSSVAYTMIHLGQLHLWIPFHKHYFTQYISKSLFHTSANKNRL